VPGLEVWRTHLRSYDGNDRSVHRVAMELVYHGARRGMVLWDEALETIKAGYAAGAQFQANRPSKTQHSLSVEVAEKIMTEAELLPLSLLAAAEATLAIRAGAGVVPVSSIAARDGWFDD